MTDAAHDGDTPPIERDTMEYDVVIVGAGPAGLSAAIRIKQLAAAVSADISVAVLEKGSEVGAHILSGVVMDPIAFDELIPDWRERDDAPLDTQVTTDKFLFLGPAGAIDISWLPMPGFMHNKGNYVGSLANVCRWLAEQAEALDVDVLPGFAAAELLFDEAGAVRGVQVGDMGVGKDGQPNAMFTPGVEIHARYTLIGEGARGSLAKRLIARYDLDAGKDFPKFGIGLKELWKVKDEHFKPGFVQHTFGWPLDNSTGGGSFLYHFGDNYVAVGFVLHLNYKNPYVSPYDEFQRFKHHELIAPTFDGAERVSYGARAITEGGYQSIPTMAFPGGVLMGCSAGLVNVPRIKGSHNAMKSGMLAAEAVVAALGEGRSHDVLTSYEEAVRTGWVGKELKRVRNVKPLWSRFGTALGVVLGGIDMWATTLFGGWSPFGTISHGKPDHASTEPASKHKPIEYPKPDGVLSFDKLTNLSMSFTNHEEDQPAHLHVADFDLQRASEHDVFAGPSTRYCPAGVYEWVTNGGDQPRFVINAQNCVHCKTCDIKDPNQNINWVTPEGGGGPNYPNM